MNKSQPSVPYNLFSAIYITHNNLQWLANICISRRLYKLHIHVIQYNVLLYWLLYLICLQAEGGCCFGYISLKINYKVHLVEMCSFIYITIKSALIQQRNSNFEYSDSRLVFLEYIVYNTIFAIYFCRSFLQLIFVLYFCTMQK